jgi:hypothetical protein
MRLHEHYLEDLKAPLKCCFFAWLSIQPRLWTSDRIVGVDSPYFSALQMPAGNGKTHHF